LKIKKKKKQIISAPTGKNNRIIYLLFLVFIPLVLYFRVINFGLSNLDDTSLIPRINNTEGSKFNLKEAFTRDALMSDKATTFYRPMQLISFMIDAELGGSEPWIYHLSNLLLHLFTVIALFFFLKMTGIKEEISFLLSLLFSVNPMLTNAVAWIPARGDLLLCLFSLLSFMTFLEYFNTKRIIYFILHSFIFLLAIFSKETSVLLPVLILSYFFFVQKEKFTLKNITPIFIIWSLIFILYFFLRQSVLKEITYSNEFGIITFIKDLPTIPITFGKFFVPYNLSTLAFFDNTGTIIGIILLIALAVLIIKGIPGQKGTVVWGALWFFAFSIPPMFFRSYSANIGYDYLEYRSYLPIIGILIIIGYLINEVTTGISFIKILKISIPLLLVYSFIAYNYSKDFADPFSFLTSAIKSSSNNTLAYQMRGTLYFDRGDYQEALINFDNSIRTCPTYSIPYLNKGLIYQKLNDHYKAENSFSLGLKYDTLYKENYAHELIYMLLSSEKFVLGKYDEAISLLRYAIGKYPDNKDLHNHLALVYYGIAKFDFALDEFNKGFESGQGLPHYYNSRGMVKDSLKDFSGAIADFSKALEINQDFSDALMNRGMTRISLSDNEGAIADLTTSINIDPNVGESWYYRGVALSNLNKKAEAKADWEKARKLGYQKHVNRK
jgi:protein O-mannosyl-transferase